MLKIRAKNYRFTATLQKKTRVQDSDGEETYTWVNVSNNVWCSLVALSGKELIAAGKEGVNYSVRIMIHKRDDIDESMRFLIDGKYYYVDVVINDPTNHLYQTIMAKTGDVNG